VQWSAGTSEFLALVRVAESMEYEVVEVAATLVILGKNVSGVALF
jgi:hypothetical protein